ncbi:MAG: hypothetical protein IJV99_01970 [Clostridia bacterium]|nr:hypothetical protein [Clostridia bacterium]
MKLSKKLCYLIAGALAVLAFIMAFVSPLKSVYGNTTYTAEAMDVYFGTKNAKGATIVFIGLIVALLTGAYFILSNFIEIPFDKIIKIVLIVLLVVVTILCFCTEAIYLEVNIPDAIKGNADAIKDWKEVAGKNMHLNIGAILAAIFSLLSAGAAAFATFFAKD